MRILPAMSFPKKHFSCFLFFTFAFFLSAHATHYRAGEIVYSLIGNFQYKCSVITYSKISSWQADRDLVELNWGDGHIDTIARVNGPINGNGFPDGEDIGNDIKRNIYIGYHTYPGAPPPCQPNDCRFYIISFFDMNRIDGINNIQDGNSVNIPFYVEDTLKFPTDISNIGLNSSPILYHYPIDYANVNDTFYHNPLAIDPDGDSLEFTLMTPLQDKQLGANIQVPLYKQPDIYCHTNGFPVNTFTLDRNNGQIVWATPCKVGIFNIAIMIREFRNGICIGTMIRDMQIIVLPNNNDPPQISFVPDTCIHAGETLSFNVTATDPNAGQTITLSADGASFYVPVSPSVFPTVSGANSVTGNFTWITICDHVRKSPYLTLFEAKDNAIFQGIAAPLVDLQPMNITVVAPPVQNLTAVATPQSVTLNWQNPYVCASSPDFRGFSVWRKVGCDSFVPSYCETGLDGHGYTKLTGANIFTYTYTDFTTVVGQQYSYRVLAHFSKVSPNGIFFYDFAVSIASDEVCVFMPVSVPVMLNVDVQVTDLANGQIFVRWSKPRAGGLNLDSLQNLPPYRFDLYRGSGFNFSNPVLINTGADAASYSAIADTFYTDNSLDTKTSPWSYRVFFYSNNDTVGFSSIASSIYLNVNSSDQSLSLNWNENVPWMNDSFSVFRLNKITSLFDSIGVSYSHTYADTGLINDSTYCYYVKGFGKYTVGGFPQPLINKSEEDCEVPIDTTAPCPPTLTVRNDCPQYENQPWDVQQFINYLSWTLQNDTCSSDITHYYIYRGDDSTGMTLIDSITSKDDTTYQHILTGSLAGCYAVTALDRIGNESRFSNVFCIDNCPYYILPNTFTPNGDGANETFHPFHPYRFVPKIEMKIFNRWGELVFETEDPEINWNGKVNNSGKDCNDGVYLYAGYYYEQRLSGLVKHPLSNQKKGGGFIHLIRGK